MTSEPLWADNHWSTREAVRSAEVPAGCSVTTSGTEDCRIDYTRNDHPVRICEKTIKRFLCCQGRREKQLLSTEHIVEEVRINGGDGEQLSMQTPISYRESDAAALKQSVQAPAVGQCLQDLLRHADELSQQHGVRGPGEAQVEHLDKGQVSQGWQRAASSPPVESRGSSWLGFFFRGAVQAQGIQPSDQRAWEDFKKDFQEV